MGWWSSKADRIKGRKRRHAYAWCVQELRCRTGLRCYDGGSHVGSIMRGDYAGHGMGTSGLWLAGGRGW